MSTISGSQIAPNMLQELIHEQITASGNKVEAVLEVKVDDITGRVILTPTENGQKIFNEIFKQKASQQNQQQVSEYSENYVVNDLLAMVYEIRHKDSSDLAEVHLNFYLDEVYQQLQYTDINISRKQEYLTNILAKLRQEVDLNYTPQRHLFGAVYNRSHGYVNYLLDNYDVKINEKNQHGETLLDIAINQRDLITINKFRPRDFALF